MLARSVPWKYMTDPMEAIERHLLAIYSALFRRGIACDFVPPTGDFTGYRLIIAPGIAVTLASDALAAGLRRFAAEGGVVVATGDLASRDACNTHYPEPRPRGLTELFGIQVGETRGLRAWNGVWSSSSETPHSEFLHAECECAEIIESLVVADAEVLGTFTTGVFRGQPSVTRRRSGKGAAYYTGTVPGGEMLEKLLEDALHFAGVEGRNLPEGVEAIECGEYRFHLNASASEATIEGLPAGETLIGERVGSTAVLGPYGVLLIRIPSPASPS